MMKKNCLIFLSIFTGFLLSYLSFPQSSQAYITCSHATSGSKKYTGTGAGNSCYASYYNCAHKIELRGLSDDCSNVGFTPMTQDGCDTSESDNPTDCTMTFACPLTQYYHCYGDCNGSYYAAPICGSGTSCNLGTYRYNADYCGGGGNPPNDPPPPPNPNPPPATVSTDIGIYLENGIDTDGRTTSGSNLESCIGLNNVIGIAGGSPVYDVPNGGSDCSPSLSIDRPKDGVQRHIRFYPPQGYKVIGGAYRYPYGTDTSFHPLMDTEDPEVVTTAWSMYIRWGVKKTAETIANVYYENGIDLGDRDSSGTPDEEPCRPGRVKVVQQRDGTDFYDLTSGGIDCRPNTKFNTSAGPLVADQRDITLTNIPNLELIGGSREYHLSANPVWTPLTCCGPTTEIGSKTVTTGTDITIRFGVREKKFTITGGAFVDGVCAAGQTCSYNLKKQAAEDFYNPAGTKASFRIVGSGETGVDETKNSNASGFTFSNLRAGTYTITYLNPNVASPLKLQYPGTSIKVKVGDVDDDAGFPGCTTSGHIQATCSSGNIVNLYFALQPPRPEPWYQAIGGDVRVDNDFDNPIPNGATCTGGTVIDYASLASANLGLARGVVVSGQLTPDLGSAKDTTVIKGYPLPSGKVRTSYTYLDDVIKRSYPTTPAPMFGSATPCGQVSTGICPSTKPAAVNFPSGVYKSNGPNGDLTFTGPADYTFPAASNYIILVPGNLTISRNLLVPVGTTVLFSVKGRIIVSSNVTTLEGIYSSDNSFDIESSLPTTPDVALRINGSIIADASLQSSNSSLNNDRDLEAQNTNCPSLKVAIRPDFILNAPEVIRFPNYVIQEIAP